MGLNALITQDIIEDFQAQRPFRLLNALYLLSTIDESSNFRAILFEHVRRYYLSSPLFSDEANTPKICFQHNSQYLPIAYPEPLPSDDPLNDVYLDYSQQARGLLDKSSGKQYYLYAMVSMRYRDNRPFRIEKTRTEFLKRLSKTILDCLACQQLPSVDFRYNLKKLIEKQQKYSNEWPDLSLELFAGCAYASSLGWQLNAVIKGEQTIYNVDLYGIRSLFHQNKSTEWISIHKGLSMHEAGFLFVTHNKDYSAALACSGADNNPLSCHGASFLYHNQLNLNVIDDIHAPSSTLPLHALLCQRLAILKRKPISFWEADHQFSISRLLAIEAKTLVEYLFLLEQERAQSIHGSIVTILTDIIRLGRRYIPQQTSDYLGHSREPWITGKAQLINQLLRLMQAHERSWSYWIERIEKLEICQIDGTTARLATMNFLLDRTYRIQNEDDLASLAEIIKTVARTWSISDSGFANRLNNLHASTDATPKYNG